MSRNCRRPRFSATPAAGRSSPPSTAARCSRPVEIGHQSAGQAELVAGLEPGAEVVLYPPSALEDGARIRPREG
jgi:hypothetical protein